MVVEIRDLHHRYRSGSGVITVLDRVDFCIGRGEFVAVMGSSGSGKSTLLHILGCLLKPSAGSYRLNREQILDLPEKRLAQIRSQHIGQVFQMFHLLPEMDIEQNVALPFLYSIVNREDAAKRVSEAIRQVGLEDRLAHKPAELSGGEMQRVAIARALAQRPDLILADEPTGNLDDRNSREILDLFMDMNRRGHTIVMVTHDAEVAACAQKTLHLRDGKLYHL